MWVVLALSGTHVLVVLSQTTGVGENDMKMCTHHTTNLVHIVCRQWFLVWI